MKTPTLLPFDLTAARDWKWPLVCRDGRKAEVLKWDARDDSFPLIGYISNPDDDTPHIWAKDGGWSGENPKYGNAEDLRLSSDFSDPAVRAAVEAAHAAGERISTFDKTSQDDQWQQTYAPEFDSWETLIYLPTRFIDQLPSPLPQPAQPWSAPEHVPGPVCWVGVNNLAQGGHGGSMVIGFSSTGIAAVNKHLALEHFTWKQIQDYNLHYSTTRTPGSWLPCTIPPSK